MAQDDAVHVDATRLVAEDPFWSVVRERHPDLDVVVLPPAAPDRPAWPDGTVPLVSLAEAADTCLTYVCDVWDAVGAPPPDGAAERWFAGALPDAVRREVTLRHRPAADVGDDFLAGAADALSRSGWSVVVPPTGVPRVLAGRDAEVDRWELQLLLGADELVMRVRSASFPYAGSVAEVSA